MTTREKAPDAFRTIGELSAELGVAQHILRYWETKFPQLKPLQRAGNRRYYRPDDVALARRIHRLLHEEGYTVKGVQKLLKEKRHGDGAEQPTHVDALSVRQESQPVAHFGAPVPPDQGGGVDVFRLMALRNRLAAALAD